MRAVNLFASPILAVSHENKTAYVVLDTGAQCSLITLKKANQFNLKLHPTIHRAVQADGETPLKVLGEVNTTFSRGDSDLHFEGLVVQNLGIDIIGGTDFHINNDISTRMAANTITINGKKVVQASTSTELEMDRLETNSQAVSGYKKSQASTRKSSSTRSAPRLPS